MDFRLLGPVEVLSAGQPVRLGGPRQRALLAHLVLNEGKVVQASRLLEELWFDPPESGVRAVHTLVSRLRQVVGDRVSTVGTGYTIRYEPGDDVDLVQFRARLAVAGATRDPAERARLLRSADALWHGGPLDDLDFPFVASEARALEELRIGAIEERIEAELEAGRDAELVSELTTLVTRYPLRERLRSEWIVALYRTGRQADALDAFRKTKRMFDEELGLELSPALAELERAILQHDPALTRPPPIPKAPASAPPRRRRLVAAAAAGALLVAAGVTAAALLAAKDAPAPVAVRTSLRTRTVVEHTTTRIATRPTRKRARHTRPTTTAGVRTVRETVPAAPTPPPPPATATTSTVAHTTTRAAATTTVRRRAPAAPAARVVKPKAKRRVPTSIADAFGAAAVDAGVWARFSSGSGWAMGISDGHLEFAFTAQTQADASDGTYGGHVETTCSFPGDFDARVDYELAKWPPANGLRVMLSAFLGSSPSGWTAERSSVGGETHASYVDGRLRSVTAVDSAGSLRVARHDGVFTSYYGEGGRWSVLATAATSGVASIGLGVVGSGTFDGEAATVDFDNFRVTGVNALCP
jgi:DNA-binding SARP family transcriptional activator